MPTTTEEERKAKQKLIRDKASAKNNTVLRTYRLKERDVKAFDVLSKKLDITKADALAYLLKLHRDAVKAA